MPDTKQAQPRSTKPSQPVAGGIGRLADPAQRELPGFPGLLRALGPGIVWMALAQGAGELIFWPAMVAKYGLGLLFLLIPACLVQYPVMYEIGRYTLLTGESIWQGFIRLNRWLALVMWALMTVSFIWLGAYVTAGELGRIQFPSGWSDPARRLFWSYTMMGVFLAALLLSGVVYRLIERLMTLVVVVTMVGLIAACTQPTVAARIPEFLGGLVRPHWPADRFWDPGDATKLLTALTYAGLGGFWTLFYSYWLREKGAGMAGHMGRLTSPIAGRPQPIPQTGYVPTDSAEGIGRWRKWRRFLWIDISVGIWGNIVTTLMCCLLAYALLFPDRRLPTDDNPVGAQAEFFASAWGPIGAILFIVVATAFLADTWMTTVDAVSRVHTDVVYAYLPRAHRWPQRRWYWLFVLLAAGLSAITLPWATPTRLMLITAVIGFAGTVTFTACLLAWNHVILPRSLPPPYRPGRWAWIGIAFSLAVYLVLASAYIHMTLL